MVSAIVPAKDPHAPLSPAPEDLLLAAELRNAHAMGQGKPAEDVDSIGPKAMIPWLYALYWARRTL